jgi:site-specific recombinase XerD
MFNGHYYPTAKEDKTQPSYKREKSLFKKWIQPTIGDLPMREIAPIHLYRIQKYMRDEGLADRSVQYALAVIRQVFNFAIRNDLWIGDNPVKKIKPPSVNNRRVRCLTPQEAKMLLESVQSRSQELFEICTLSLLRFETMLDSVWKPSTEIPACGNGGSNVRCALP